MKFIVFFAILLIVAAAYIVTANAEPPSFLSGLPRVGSNPITGGAVQTPYDGDSTDGTDWNEGGTKWFMKYFRSDIVRLIKKIYIN